MQVAVGEMRYKSSGGSNVGVIAGACAGVAVVLVLIIVITCVIHRRKQQEKESEMDRKLREKLKREDAGFNNPSYVDPETGKTGKKKTAKKDARKNKEVSMKTLDEHDFPALQKSKDDPRRAKKNTYVDRRTRKEEQTSTKVTENSKQAKNEKRESMGDVRLKDNVFIQNDKKTSWTDAKKKKEASRKLDNIDEAQLDTAHFPVLMKQKNEPPKPNPRPPTSVTRPNTYQNRKPGNNSYLVLSDGNPAQPPPNSYLVLADDQGAPTKGNNSYLELEAANNQRSYLQMM